MHRKSLLSLFMLCMGVALIAAAMVVGTASAKTQRAASGGTLIVTQAGGAFDTLDPELSYVSNDWGLEANTALTLLGYPTKAGIAGTKLVPMAATAFPKQSNGGKTYVIHIRSGLKLSNGAPITAANYVRAFERTLSPKMFAQNGIYDGFDKFLVGGSAFANGNASSISGLDANGLTLTIHLTEVVPQFDGILGMLWLQAIPSNLKYVNGKHAKSAILTYPSGGPYYIAKNDLTSYTLLKRNPHFPSTPYFRSNWPSNPLQIVVKTYPNSSGTPQLLQAEKNQVDIAGVASQDVNSVVHKYGVNKHQFLVGGTTCIDWVTLNNDSGNGTTNSKKVRDALNWAISRQQMINYNGKYSGVSSQQVLVPQIPGYHKFSTFGNGAGDLAKAKQVGGSALNNAPLNIYYLSVVPSMKAQAEYIYNLAQQLGMKPNLQDGNPLDFYSPMMTKSIATGANGFNLAVFGGWCADYPDGYDYYNVNFDGRTIGAQGNTDYAYFNSDKFNSDMDAAAALTGSARATAYQNLDYEFMHTYDPIVPQEIAYTRTFISNRVHNYVYSDWWGQPFWNAIKLS